MLRLTLSESPLACITRMSVKRGLTGTALTFSLNSTRLIRTPRYYGQFFCFVPRESQNIFSKFNPLNTDTPLLRTVFLLCPSGKPEHFL